MISINGRFRISFNRHGAAPLVWSICPLTIVDGIDTPIVDIAVRSIGFDGARVATVYAPKVIDDDDDGVPSAYLVTEGSLAIDTGGVALISRTGQVGDMRRVVVESPYAGDLELNARYLSACLRDCIRRGEAPFASHAMYTRPGVLDDNNPEQRLLGIATGFAWRAVTSATVVYTDLGTSDGMRAGVEHALSIGGSVEYRSLGAGWDVRRVTHDHSFVGDAEDCALCGEGRRHYFHDEDMEAT